MAVADERSWSAGSLSADVLEVGRGFLETTRGIGEDY